MTENFESEQCDDPLVVLTREVRRFVEERDWEQFHTPKNLAAALCVEASELLEHFQWLTGAESLSLPDTKRRKIGQELGDVLLYLVRLADVLDLDLIETAERKLEENRRRYPIEKVKGKALKYDQYDR